jgi:hypothetical protein
VNIRWTVVALVIGLCIPAGEGAAQSERAGFVTTLGKDTVALESFTRTPTRLEGRIVVRVPGTVLIRYEIRLRDGRVTRSRVETTPMGTTTVQPQTVTLDFVPDSVRATISTAGTETKSAFAVAAGSPLLFTTGFGSSFGLYASLGMYELMLADVRVAPGDTASVAVVAAATGRAATRLVLRRSPTEVSVDYFKIAWTHLKLDEQGRILTADASETTEKVMTTRTDAIDIEREARRFAFADSRGKGIGVASVDTLVRSQVGAATLVLQYGQPRRRGRDILGAVVPYDRVWRTGANAASALTTSADLIVGDKVLPAGSYSLWTLPRRDGVDLVINRQIRQWGTAYDPAHDFVRIPMSVATVASPLETFVMRIAQTGAMHELRIEWDTFAWSVPVRVK